MKTIDGQTYENMVLNGYRDLKIHYEKINELNVFPVPDGDTGTNIAATMSGGVKSMEMANTSSLGDVATKFSEGMLLGARGNSGVILSQFFSGIASSLEGLKQANVNQFAEALKNGTQKAYEAVVRPVEGTILTVAREGSDHVIRNLKSITDFENLFRIMLEEMRASLQRTTELLPILKEAGVIDSGGAGLLYIMEGMGKEIIGEEIADSVFKGPTNELPQSGKIQFNENSVLTYGYCTEFILQLQNSKVDPATFDIKALINYLSTIGDSIVAIKQGTIVKIHVHTKTPSKAIEYAQKYGEFVTFKMENMSIQHNEVLMNKETPATESTKSAMSHKHVNVAIVAVSPSETISRLFKDMGVNEVVNGGQTMNPSAQDFLNAFAQIDADNIVVFPNNGNVILTANQAAKMYDKANVIVLESKSVPEAYSAISMADPENESLEENIRTMKESMERMVSAEVCPAIRDSTNNGIAIKKGHFMGILKGNVVSEDANLIKATAKLFKHVNGIDEKEVLTVFYGIDAEDKHKQSLKEYIEKTYPLIEIIEIEGGQTIYPFVFAVE